MGGLETGPSRRAGFNLLRVHFWTPVQRKRVSKRGQKVVRLKSKVVPPKGPILVPFRPPHCGKSVEALFQVEADLTSNSCSWNLELGSPIFGRLLFLTF